MSIPRPSLSAAQLSEYDFYVLMDRSGSMADPRGNGVNTPRWNYAQELITGIAKQLTGIDDDGITVVFFNNNAQVHQNVKTPDQVATLFAGVQPGGGTSLLPALKAIETMRKASNKKAFVIIGTDGEANDAKEVGPYITGLANGLSGDGQLSIQFIQIGNDSQAADFLRNLDDGLQRAGAKFDIVNCCTDAEAENLSLGELMYLAQND